MFRNYIFISILDVNECDDDVSSGSYHECDDVCNNVAGSYSCECAHPGYELDTDNRTCLGKFCNVNRGFC